MIPHSNTKLEKPNKIITFIFSAAITTLVMIEIIVLINDSIIFEMKIEIGIFMMIDQVS